MSKSINEIIKESIIEGLGASNITAGNLTKALIEAKEDSDSIFDSILEELTEDEEFIPEFGDVYWFIDGDGEAAIQKWIGDAYDKNTLKNNAIFETQEAAEFEAERLKVFRELEKMGRPFDFALENWGFYLNEKGNIGYYYEIESTFMYGKSYFNSKDEVIKAVEKIGEDRICKYLFNEPIEKELQCANPLHPKEGDEYWYIGRGGSAYGDYWFDDEVDEANFAIGNVFKRKEDVVHAIGKLKVMQELRELGRPFKRGDENWHICLNYDDEVDCIVEQNVQSLYSPLYFDTEEKAQGAIDKVGADRIKKYLFDRTDCDLLDQFPI